ncbi:Ubiquitin thioesterase OTU1 [Schistosoma japonicum]|uniref:Ubiquitin thioesterase OTU n=2 Tax=Schistosoma japonicum TaxID=6182 RepID=A0A4Z2D7T1_SCHJA|nr:Ubiquitin thioesterase OTU1 [Schistosoma japonicum]
MDIDKILLSQFPDSQHPYVAKGIAGSWESCQKWDLCYLSGKIKSALKFRLAKRESAEVQWETSCPSISATLAEFNDWINGVDDKNNPFSMYPKEFWWAYADYIYMTKSTDFKELIKDLSFQELFPCLNNNTISPTFWLGSSKAHTICHRDTYGFNIVVQIKGSKRWILFPPSDNPYMYETRLPLEESTVFSKVNFTLPNYKEHPNILKTTPYPITLYPGDILFVPRNWWHFVESSSQYDFTCSVNLWIDQPSLDNKVRFRECLTQLVGFSLISSCNHSNYKVLLHPSEQETYEQEFWSENLLDFLRLLCHRNSPKSCSSMGKVDCEEIAKRSKFSNISWTPLVSENFDKLFTVSEESLSYNVRKVLSFEQVISTFMKPDVIELVAKYLENDVINESLCIINIHYWTTNYLSVIQMQSCLPNSTNLLKLRCRYRTGQYNLNNLTSDSTIDDLLQTIASLISVAQSRISLYYGYPPKKLDCSISNLNKHLWEIPLRSGDMITVDVIEEKSINVNSSTIKPQSHERVIPINNKQLESRIVRLSAPSDNSCLFTSVLFCVNNYDNHLKIGTEVITNIAAVSQLRELISGIVLSDPIKYSEAFLGMSNEEYSLQIRQSDKWGGGIEVSILSQLYEVEICIVDIESCRIDRFGEDQNYAKRILLIYDGIHYDPLAQECPSRDCLVTVFSSNDDTILLEAQQLASNARAEWAFTDLSSFTLLCRQCDAPLVGQVAAQKHAQLTGHTQFKEIIH